MHTVATSSMEFEYMAMYAYIQELVLIRGVFGELELAHSSANQLHSSSKTKVPRRELRILFITSAARISKSNGTGSDSMWETASAQ